MPPSEPQQYSKKLHCIHVWFNVQPLTFQSVDPVPVAGSGDGAPPPLFNSANKPAGAPPDSESSFWDSDSFWDKEKTDVDVVGGFSGDGPPEPGLFVPTIKPAIQPRPGEFRRCFHVDDYDDPVKFCMLLVFVMFFARLIFG